MIVIGTAGHIDHGKSAIVKRLTGTDPDRLPEEKARGMTIDLGFAFLDLNSGEKIAFIDVPGHERFVRNMIAGAGGIDAVIMVIAADDGWMPQSQEHFQIIRLLGVKSGLIVINKCDLADPEWLELLAHEISEKVAGSFLENVPIINISAKTGLGFDRLISEIETLAGNIGSRNNAAMARLYADRAFVRQGIGQVVTGTLRGGDFTVGQPALIWPANIKGKIRTLQSEGEDVETVSPGSRTAISMTGIDRQQLVRGSVILNRTDVDYFVERPVLALQAELLSEAPISLEDRRRVLLIIGSSETEGELRLYDQKEIKPGQSGLIFFKPDDPLFTLVGDHFVFRLVTPMVTLGGGLVLDHLAHFPRRKEFARYEYLKNRLHPTLENLVTTELEKLVVSNRSGFLHQVEASQKKINQAIETLVKTEAVGRDEQLLFHVALLEKTGQAVITAIESWLQENPHQKGLSMERLRRSVDLERSTLTNVLELMVRFKQLTFEGEMYNVAGRGVALKGVIKQAYEEIMELLKASPFGPPTLANLAKPGKQHQQAIKFILDTGEVHKCGSDFIFLSEVWDEITDFIRKRLTLTGEMKPSDLRDEFKFSRKWVIPILEETDRLGLTERTGDIRIKGAKFEQDQE